MLILNNLAWMGEKLPFTAILDAGYWILDDEAPCSMRFALSQAATASIGRPKDVDEYEIPIAQPHGYS